VLTYFADAKTGLPTSYSAYAAQPIDVDSSKFILDSLVFDLTPPSPPLAVNSIGGVVTSSTSQNRENLLWLWFDSNASIRLAQHEPTSSEFSYLVPELPASNITVAAAESDGFMESSSYAIAYRSGISPGQSDVELDIPTPSELLEPAAAESVDATTVFSWQNQMPISVLMLWNIPERRFIYVVTAEKQASVPEALFAATKFRQNATWLVHTYGTQPDMDATVLGEDFVPAYDGAGFPEGNGRKSGSYTRSRSRLFRLAD
jgi:hypothetical protein